MYNVDAQQAVISFVNMTSEYNNALRSISECQQRAKEAESKAIELKQKIADNFGENIAENLGDFPLHFFPSTAQRRIAHKNDCVPLQHAFPSDNEADEIFAQLPSEFKMGAVVGAFKTRKLQGSPILLQSWIAQGKIIRLSDENSKMGLGTIYGKV